MATRHHRPVEDDRLTVGREHEVVAATVAVHERPAFVGAPDVLGETMRGGLERLTLGRTAPVVTRLGDRQRRRAGDIAQQGRGGGDQLDEGLVVLIELRRLPERGVHTGKCRERCAQLVVAGWFAEPIDRPGIAHVLDEEGVATLGRAQVLDRVARDPPLHPDRQRLDDPHDNRARLAVRAGVVIGAEVLRGTNRNPLGIPLIEADLAGIGVIRLRDATGLGLRRRELGDGRGRRTIALDPHPDGLAGHAHATAKRLDADVVDRARLPGPAKRLTHPGGSEFVGGVRDERVLRLRHRCGH